MTHFATVWSLLLLVTGFPHEIPVATYYTEEACKEAITKMINQFDGAGSNYNGAFRNASDKNTTFFYARPLLF